MHRDTEGLRRSARLRREEAMQRALIALSRMEGSDREINFRTVAAEARVSTAWLYNQRELRARIMRLRRSQTWKSSPEFLVLCCGMDGNPTTDPNARATFNAGAASPVTDPSFWTGYLPGPRLSALAK